MRLRIVAVNDVYALENLPRLATVVRAAREVDPADVLLVTVAGDFLAPSILSSLDAGRGMVACLNAIGFTHVTFGNHEDDLETEELLARTRELSATWLASNVRTFRPDLPASQILEHGGVRFGLLGVVTVDPGMYRRAPFGGGAHEEPIACALRETARLLRDEGCRFVIPLTHQALPDDRALVTRQRTPPYPVVLGGHEHQGIVEDVLGTPIVKARADAAEAAIVEIVADARQISTTVRVVDVTKVEEDLGLRAMVDRHMARVRALEEAVLLELPPGQTLSSVGTRTEQTSMGTLVASAIRDALGAEGALFNGGGIRAGRVYEGAFTYGALKAEVPFDNEVVVVRIPGRVLAEAVAFSRANAPVPSGGFLQVDDGMIVAGPAHELVQVGGAPLDPERDYRIALVRRFLLGLDDQRPLVDWAAADPSRVPPADSGKDVRVVLTDAFAVRLWRTLGGFDAVDANADQRVTFDEVKDALARITGHRRPEIAAGLILGTLDTNRDTVITRDEADAVAPPMNEE